MLMRAGTLIRSPRSQLPVRVLLHDLAVAERPQVAAADLEPLTVCCRAAQRPLARAAVAVDEVVVVLVADVRNPREPGRERLADGVETLEPVAPRRLAAGRLEHGVVGEVAQDPVQ